MLDLHVVVAEVDRSACELLAIQSDIDGVRQHLWVKVVQLRNLRDDLAIFEVAFCRDPSILIGRCIGAYFRPTALGPLAGSRTDGFFTTVH